MDRIAALPMPGREPVPDEATVAQWYRGRVRAGTLSADPAQEKVAAALDRVLAGLEAAGPGRKASPLGWLFARQPSAAVKGLYVHGGVGRGKTMLMDAFFARAPVRAKWRVHFNDFMAEVHDRIQSQRAARKSGASREDDPIPPVARQIAEKARLLCFDEFSVTDIADAMVLSRLFSALFGNGVTLVATSNVAPEDLYRDGLNRALFEPFIGLLRRNVEVVAMAAGPDHREEKLDRMPVYLTPLDAETARAMDEAWEAVTHGRKAGAAALRLKGREIAVPRAAGDAARFAFADLFEKPLGARDYLALAERFSTVFVDGVPALDPARRNEAKRLILFIDVAYDRHLRLVISAAVPPEGIYSQGRGAEAFEIARAASRLREMQSSEWLDDWRRRHAAGG